MPKYAADRESCNAQKKTVPVAGGTLVYDVKRETTRLGTRTVGWELVDVDDVTDRDALADALADLDHSRRRAYEPDLEVDR
jgi:hypothetical protein